MDDDLLLDSLRRRMRAMHSLYEDATSSMDLHHVNHFEREGVLPIAFSLFHYINMEDSSYFLITGELPVFNEQWAERIDPAIADHGKHKTVDEMIHQRIGNLDEFVAYMGTVFARTETWLQGLVRSDLDRVVIARPLPPQVASTYSARVAGEAGITVLDATECWMYQHGLRHMGEIELGRGLVGLQGMTS
jgi:hypothetical protein